MRVYRVLNSLKALSQIKYFMSKWKFIYLRIIYNCCIKYIFDVFSINTYKNVNERFTILEFIVLEFHVPPSFIIQNAFQFLLTALCCDTRLMRGVIYYLNISLISRYVQDHKSCQRSFQELTYTYTRIELYVCDGYLRNTTLAVTRGYAQQCNHD